MQNKKYTPSRFNLYPPRTDFFWGAGGFGGRGVLLVVARRRLQDFGAADASMLLIFSPYGA